MARTGASVAGFVLAGGQSRRMGRDKALLTRGGRTLLEQAVAAVSEAAGNCRVVAPAGRYPDLPVDLLPDRWPGEGPLGGVLTAMGSTTASLHLVAAVDMPLLDPAFLRNLLMAAEETGRSVVPVDPAGRAHPLCAVYHREAEEGLRRYFDHGGRRMMDAIGGIRIHSLPLDSDSVRNVNTPADWEALKR